MTEDKSVVHTGKNKINFKRNYLDNYSITFIISYELLLGLKPTENVGDNKEDKDKADCDCNYHPGGCTIYQVI